MAEQPWESDHDAPPWMADTPIEQKSGKGPTQRIEERERIKAQIEEQTGGTFDPSKGIEGFWARFDLSRVSSLPDVATAVKDKLPGSEVQVVETEAGGEVVFRPLGEKDWRRINPEGFDLGDVGGVTGAILTEETVAAVVIGVATKSNPFHMRALWQAGAGFISHLVHEGVEFARGRNTDPLSVILGRSAIYAGLGLAGEAGGSLLSRGIRIPAGGGFLKPTPAGEAAIAASKELDLPLPTAGQLNEVVARREAQAAVTGERIKMTHAQQKKAVKDATQKALDELGPVERSMVAEIEAAIQTIRDSLDVVGTKLSEGGKALQKGIDDFTTASRAWVNKKYTDALALADDVTFNLEPTRKAVAKLREPISAVGKDGSQINVAQPISKDLRALTQRIDLLDDIQPGKEGYEAIKNLRSQAGDMANGNWQAASGAERREMLQARNIYNSLTEVLEGAKSSNAAFNLKWKAANTSNAWREGILDLGHIAKIAKSENPADLLSYARPGQFLNLRLIKRIMPKENWQKFTNSFEAKLLAEPEKIIGNLRAFRVDQEALDLLMPVARQREFLTLGRAVEKYGKMTSLLKEQSTAGQNALRLIDNGHGDAVKAMIKEAGGATSDLGKTIRAGVFENILEKGSIFDKTLGKMVLDPAKAKAIITKYLESGQLKGILTPKDIKTLGLLREYINVLPTGADMGASLAGAETAAAAMPSLANPSTLARGWAKLLSNAGYGRMFTNPTIVRYLFGGGKNLQPLTSVRVLSTVFSLSAADVQDEIGD